MSGIREWSVVVCLAALSAALLQSLVPNGSMERMARFVIGAIVICALIAPITKIVPQIRSGMNDDGHLKENTELQSTVNNQIISASQKSIRNLVTAELNKIHIKCKNVRVDMDTNKNGRISINKIFVTVGKEYSAECEKASDYLEKELGIQTEVVSDGG